MDALEPVSSGPRPFPTRAEVRVGATRSREFLVDLGTLSWRRAVLRNLLTTCAVLLSVVFVFLLPQTQHILWQLPGIQGLSGSELLQATLMYLFVLALTSAYLFLLVTLVPSPAEGSGWSTSRLGSGGWERIDPHVAPPPTRPDRTSRFAEFLIRSAWRLTPRARLRLGWAGMVLGALAFLVTQEGVGRLGPAQRSGGLLGGMFLALLGAWMTLLPRPAAEADGTPASPERATRELGYKMNLCGRALWYLLLATSFGELLWTLAHTMPDLASFRIYTIWAVAQLVFLILAGARVVDACHVYSRWNIRALVAIAGLALFTSLPSKQVGRFWAIGPRPTRDLRLASPGAASPAALMPTPNVPPAAPMPAPQAPSPARTTAYLRPAPAGAVPALARRPESAGSPVLPMDQTIDETWFTAVRARLDAIPPGPVYVVSASGGGSRAALFTSLVLEALRNTDAPQGFGESPLWPAGLGQSDQERREAAGRSKLADRILMISAVSGGSLASAYYLSQEFTHVRSVRGREASRTATTPVLRQETRRERWQNAYRGDHYARMLRIALSRLDEARSGRASRIGAINGRGFLETMERVADECVEMAAGRAPGDPIAPWLPTSAFVDDMATDFMAPLLRGIITPGIERGECVSRFWEDRFGWENVEDLDLHRKLDPDAPDGQPVPRSLANQAPIALFNACDVTRGSRVILGFPPVPPGIVTDPLVNTSASGPYSLTDRGDLYYHLSLAEAVRLSANFPWGFETATLALRGGDESILVLDGGIVDNSGIDSVTYLLQGLARRAQSYQAMLDGGKAAGASYAERESFALINELRRRGVVLIQIDSGTKDIKAGGTSVFSLLDQVAPVLFRPIQALNNTSYTNADLAILGHDRAIGDALAPSRASFQAPGASDPCRALGDARLVMPSAPAKVMPFLMPAPPAPPAPPGGTAPPPERVLPSSPSVSPSGPPSDCGPAPEPVPGQYPADPPGPAPQDVPVMVRQAVPSSNVFLPPLYRRVRLTCNITENVMTAWALGPDDKAQVMVQFLIEWTNQHELVEKTFQHVHGLSHLYAEAYPGGLDAVRDALWEDYRVFQTGQTLDDRARTEAYRAQSPGVAPQAFPLPMPWQSPPNASDPALDRLNQFQSSYHRSLKYDATPQAPLPDLEPRAPEVVPPPSMPAPAPPVLPSTPPPVSSAPPAPAPEPAPATPPPPATGPAPPVPG